ncbi:MAG: hypothetical protein HPY76_10515 [Anaerolineae bacterium]|nr:hypothetical protein [Anaerolineae bacterium]
MNYKTESDIGQGYWRKMNGFSLSPEELPACIGVTQRLIGSCFCHHCVSFDLIGLILLTYADACAIKRTNMFKIQVAKRHHHKTSLSSEGAVART